jgi:hypothetical protein
LVRSFSVRPVAFFPVVGEGASKDRDKMALVARDCRERGSVREDAMERTGRGGANAIGLGPIREELTVSDGFDVDGRCFADLVTLVPKKMGVVKDGSSGRGAAGRVGLARGLLGGVRCGLGLLRFALRLLRRAVDTSSFSTDPNPMVSEKTTSGSDGSSR